MLLRVAMDCWIAAMDVRATRTVRSGNRSSPGETRMSRDAARSRNAAIAASRSRPTGIQISHENRSASLSGNASSSSVHSARTLAARIAWMASSSLRLSRGRPRRFCR